MATRTLTSALGLLLIVAAVAEGGPTKKIVVIEHSLLSKTLRWTKDGKNVKAPAAGDSQVYVADILHPTTKRKIGTDTGYCIYTYKTLNVCTITTSFKGGSITMSGAFDDSKTVQDLAIVGGTGAYAGAKGYVKTYFIDMTKTAVTVRNEFYLM